MASMFRSVLVFSSLITIIVINAMDNPCSSTDGGQTVSCTPLTRSEKEQLLDLHNELRDRVAGGGLVSEGQPAATDMNQLLWDEGLEAVAQTYAETCPGFAHNDPGAGIQYLAQRNAGNVKWGPDNEYLGGFCGGQDCIYIGENLFAGGSTPYSISYVLSVIEHGWWDEYKVWSFGAHNQGCQAGRVCGHYTQMAWANTRYIGCGYSNGCANGRFFVCNYWPPGNFNSVPPYTSGQQCSNCMADRESCRSDFSSVSINSGLYPQQPYNALCGGGVCKTMCDGASYNRGTCDATGCNGNANTIDCNDGTRSLTRGRDICTATTPTTTTTPSPVAPNTTPQPTTSTTVGATSQFCCQAAPGAGNRWTATCAAISNEATCLSQRRSSCEWVECSGGGGGPGPIGTCQWDGQGSRDRTNACGREDNQDDCVAKVWNQGACIWIPTAFKLDHKIEFNEAHPVYLERSYDNVDVYGTYLFLIIVGVMILYLCKKCGRNEKTIRDTNGEGIYGAIGNDAI